MEGMRIMRILSTHSRDLDAAPAAVGALIESLGSDRDELWPSERWPGIPIHFDRPLAVGARGGHGLIRYSVEEYEPDWLVVMRFDLGQALEGIHRIDVEWLGSERSRLVHTLDVRVEGSTLLVSPVLRRMHDALIEDLPDRAEAATSGTAPAAAPLPAWMRALNAVEARVAERSGQPGHVAGRAVPAALAAISALHAAWALGWRWPGGSDAAFVERVVRNGKLPPAAACWAVAGLLATAAGIVRADARGSASTLVRSGTWTIATVFLARGSSSLAYDAVKGLGTTYRRYDATIYSPLSLALGAGALVARGQQTG
jgi:hypothetical protein